jgi:hypothetical protein
MAVFVSYSHADEAWKDQVVRHLRVLELQGDVELWDDRRIVPGEDWSTAIFRALESADVALLLVSANSLTSEFILSRELPELLRLRAQQGLRLIPVIVRPCAWRDVPWLAPIQVFPRDGRALSELPEHEVDSELAALAREVRRSTPEGSEAGSGNPSPPTVPPLVAPESATAGVERPAGDPLDGYELVKVVQVGNYSRVLKCTVRETGETCIVKETDANRVSERALEALGQIACPNVAGPRRVWRTVDKVYEQLPYVGGIPLQEAVAPDLGGLAGSMLESFHRQIRQVLATLHGAGIVHRDIHPANIYVVVKRPSDLAGLPVTDAESAWIFDAFGEGDDAFLVAWIVVDLTFATLVGDEQEAYRHGPYTPEEQQNGAATTASDMYAFGATLFFGQSGVDPPSPLDRRVNPRADEGPSQAWGFELYLRRLLALDPAERPPASERFREGSVAPGFTGVLRVDDDRFALVDMFPEYTRAVSGSEALRDLRQRQRDWGEPYRTGLGRWIDWVEATRTGALRAG